MAKEYIGSQEHFEDVVNAYYDQKEQMERDMQQQYEKDMMNQIERDFYAQQPHEGRLLKLVHNGWVCWG